MPHNSIFLNSSKILNLYMPILELLTSIFNVSLVAAGFIATSLLVIGLLIFEAWKRNWVAVTCQQSNNQILANEDVVSQNVRKHLFFLKHIARQISEDRKRIGKSVSKDHFDLQEKIYGELELFQPSIHQTLYASLQQKYSAQDKQTEDILKNLGALESDFSVIKSQLKYVAPVSSKLAKVEEAKKYPPSTPTDVQERANVELKEDHELEFLPKILIVVKESLENHISENRAKGREMIESLSRFLDHSQKDIQKQLNIFSAVVDKSEHDDGKNANLSLIEEVEKTEKNLLAIFTFLNRQRFDMENLKKTLVYFNNRFVYFVAKLDSYWQQSMASYCSASQHLVEAEILSTSVTEKMDRGSGTLIQQSKLLTSMLAEMKNMLKFEQRNDQLPRNYKQFDGPLPELTDKADISLVESIDRVNQELQKFVSVTENSQEQLNSLIQTSKKLESFHNVINSVTDGYNTMLTLFLSSLARKKKNDRNQNTAQKKGEKNDKSGSETGDSRKNEMNDSCSVNGSTLDEVRHELSTEDQNVDNIIFMMKDIVKTSWKLVDHEKNRIENPSVPPTAQNNLCDLTDESEGWADIPSESFLSDVSSDFLIQNSSNESDEASETNIER